MLQTGSVVDAMIRVILGTKIMMMGAVRLTLYACCTHKGWRKEDICENVVRSLGHELGCSWLLLLFDLDTYPAVYQVAMD